MQHIESSSKLEEDQSMFDEVCSELSFCSTDHQNDESMISLRHCESTISYGEKIVSNLPLRKTNLSRIQSQSNKTFNYSLISSKSTSSFQGYNLMLKKKSYKYLHENQQISNCLQINLNQASQQPLKEKSLNTIHKKLNLLEKQMLDNYEKKTVKKFERQIEQKNLKKKRKLNISKIIKKKCIVEEPIEQPYQGIINRQIDLTSIELQQIKKLSPQLADICLEMFRCLKIEQQNNRKKEQSLQITKIEEKEARERIVQLQKQNQQLEKVKQQSKNKHWNQNKESFADLFQKFKKSTIQ